MDIPKIGNEIQAEHRCKTIGIDGQGNGTKPKQNSNIGQNDCIVLVRCKHHRLRIEV